MITNLEALDCLTNSPCERLGKYVEKSMENFHINLVPRSYHVTVTCTTAWP